MAGTNVINDYVAGAIGGCAGMAVGHPLDTIKVQLQTQDCFRGIRDCMLNLSHQTLRKGFFRGLSWPLASFAVVNSMFFGAYGHTLSWFEHHLRAEDIGPHAIQILTAGILATFPTGFIACPIDVIKVTLQSQIQHDPHLPANKYTEFYRGPLEATRKIYKRSGIRGLYRGFWTQLARDCPANALYMSFYEVARFESRQFLPQVPNQAINFVCGGFAGVFSWMAIMPFDFVKSRIQADSQRVMYKGFWDCVHQSYAEGGAKIFFRGAAAVCLRAFPVNAVTLMVYSEILYYLNKSSW